MKTITHTQVVKQQNLTVKQQIQQTLGITHEQYCELQYNMGLSYLNLETEGNYPQTQIVAETKVFWSWWMNHWYKRDAKFLELPVYLKTGVKFYNDFNNPNSITFNNANGQLCKSYELMVRKLLKKELKNA